MEFKEWLLISEGVDANMGEWIKTLAHYARPEERRILDTLFDIGFLRTTQGKTGEYELRQDYDAIVKGALKEKRKEDMNWLAFALGYLSTKAFRREDLEIAIDQLEMMKAAGDVPRAEIGRLGWMQMGASMQERIAEYNRKATRISRTQSKKMAEKGEVAEADAHLIKHVAKEGNLDLYYLPPVRTEQDIEGRQRLLCKYGKGTEWCTAAPGRDAHRYYKSVGIFIVHSGGNPKYQFVDCTDAPDRSEEYEEGDGMYQFMDVHDQPVKSLTPTEQKFLNKNADITCYDLAPDGFENIEDFLSSSDEKVRSLSGNVASQVLAMAGRSIGKVMARLGPVISRMDNNNIISLANSESWGAEMADQILDSLASLRTILEDEPRRSNISSRSEKGAVGLMVRSLATSANAAIKAKPLAEFIGGPEISRIFRLRKEKTDDDLLKSIMHTKKEMDNDTIVTVLSKADDFGGILNLIGTDVAKLFKDNSTIAGLYENIRVRKDGSMETLSRFLEGMITKLPADAVTWALFLSSDNVAAAKRMLSSGLDGERIKKVFEIKELTHLADDSHIKTLSNLRNKEGDSWEGLAAMAGRFGNRDERVESMLRFLKNSDDLEGREVMSVIEKANEEGNSEKMAERIPQEMIDMISLDDLNIAAKKAEKSCTNYYGVADKERGGCDGGKPLVAVLKRTKLHFPMRHAIYMKSGKERDDLMIKNLKGSDARDVRHALDIVEDTNRFVEELLRVRGGKISPGEVASIIGHSDDKKKALELFKDKIDSLGAPYEPYETSTDRIYGFEEGNEDWIDMLTNFRGMEELADDLLKHYRKHLKPKAIYNLIKKSKHHDQESMVEKLKEHIANLDLDSYVKLRKLMKPGWNSEISRQTISLVDEVRNGGPAKPGDVVVSVDTPKFEVESTPEEGGPSMAGNSGSPPESTNIGNANQMKYKVVGNEGEHFILSPMGEFKTRISHYEVNVDEKWRLKANKGYFIILRRYE